MRNTLLCIRLSLLLTSCSANPTDRADIVELFNEKEDIFIRAGETGDYSAVEVINGVQGVNIYDDHVDILCGGSGFGSSTNYLGIFLSPVGDLTAVDVACPPGELAADGRGYRYIQSDGDNKYYADPLGNHFFYYNAQF